MSLLSIGLFVVIVLILLILSGFISAIETAYTSASKGKLQTYIKKGNKKAVDVEDLRRAHLTDIFSVLLAFETILETLATSVATWAISLEFGAFGVAIATSVMGVLILVYGEIIPKQCAIQYPESIALKTVRIIRFALKVFKPLIYLSNWIARNSLALVGFSAKKDSHHEYIDELKGAIALHANLGTKARNEKLMLESVLDLADLDVDEIMTHRKNMVMLDAAAPLEHVLEQVLSSPYTRHPVWMDNRENIIGILHTKDLLRAITLRDSTEEFSLQEVCSHPWFIPESTSLLDQLNEFRSRREHLACVVDEYGALKGLVTLEDILEEIVGQIDDEHDIALGHVHKENSNTFSVHGWSSLRDINREFDLNLPDEEAATIAGLIIHETEQIPDVGQEFMLYGVRCKILAKKRNQITRVRITYTPEHRS